VEHQQSVVPHFGRIISALFLVAGTCIGGGMLALPVATGMNGFLPSLTVMFICWAAMTASALLLLEVSMWMEEGVHLITMASRILGVPGKVISWILYLFICYASLVAYTAGGGMQIAAVANNYFGFSLSNELGAVIFILLFGGLFYLGNEIIGRVNTMLFGAMVLAYVILIGIGIPEINPELLFYRQWSGTWMAISLMLTTFSFQTMVPSLTPYLKANARALRISVIGGTLLTFLIYAIWLVLVLGIVPVEGEKGLTAAFVAGEPATQFLREHVQGEWVYVVAEYFAFFAIVTSFFGIGFGLYDFLADGLKIKKQGIGQVILGLLLVVPTLICATYFERIFLVALETTGGFGDTVLNGLIPVAMVWMGRYHLGLSQSDSFRLGGGKPVLIIVFVFFLVAFLLAVASQFGII